MNYIANAAKLTLLTTLFFLVACGDATISFSGIGQQPPRAPGQPLALDEANALDSAAVATTMIEGVLQLTELGAQIIQTVDRRSEIQFSDTCTNGGTTDYDFSDNDQDGKPSPGDSIRTTFSNCQLLSLNASATGEVVITLEPPTTPDLPEDRNWKGQIDASLLDISISATGTATVAGNFGFEVAISLVAESRRAMGSADFIISDVGVSITEKITTFDFKKSSSFESARYEISAAGLVDSEILNGVIEYDATMMLSGFLNTYPEQGRLELKGANGTRVGIVPNFDTSSNFARIEVDSAGSGAFVELPNSPSWTQLVEGYLWWYEPGSPTQFQTRQFQVNDYFVIHQTPSNDEIVGVNPVLRIQFSRPVDVSTIPAIINLERQFTDPPFTEETPLDVDVRGATVILRPMQQLRHGFQHFYPAVGFNTSDALGNSAFVAGSGFITDDTLSSVATTSVSYSISGDTVDLDGTLSAAVGSTIQSYLWTQTGGPAVTLVDANLASASFTVPVLAAPAVIELQLEIVDAEGESDWTTVEIPVFGSIAGVQVLKFDGTSGDYITQGIEWFLTSISGSFTISRNFDNGIMIRHDGPLPNLTQWTLEFAAPGDVDIVVGAYNGATRYPFQAATDPGLSLFGDGRGCNQLTGSFDVLEVSYDIAGDVLSAAIDFEQFCEGGPEKANGYLRIGSTIPIPNSP